MLPPNQPPSATALFRFRVLSEILARVQRGEILADAVLDVATLPHEAPNRDPVKVSPRTLYRWLEYFGHDRNLARLEPASRQRTESSIVLPPRLLDFIAAEKKQDVGASIPEILRRARAQGIIAQADRIDRSTVYRACQRLNIPVLRRLRGALRDSRRFAYPHRMDLCLSDGKHFRAGSSRARRVAMFFLDDSSRFGLHVVVGTSENAALFLRGLYGAIQHHGIADIYYLDHGAGFTSDDTTAILPQLPALLIHGEKAYPEGHGKIERFHRTAIAACLRNLDGRADVDPACSALELRISHWLRETYNHTPHESLESVTGVLQSPWARFSADKKSLRFPESLPKLREKFLVELRRKVTADHIVSIDGVHFETPRGLAGSWIVTYRQVLDGTVHVLHEGRLLRLTPVDLAANAHTHRGTDLPAEEVQTPLPKSAADMAFERDFRPITDADGNFSNSNPKE